MNKVDIDQAIPVLGRHDWDVVKKIHIGECGETLILIPNDERLKQDPIYFKHKIAHAIDQCLARESVVEKLQKAVTFLPSHLGIVVLDAWRSRDVQQALLDQIGDVIRKDHPDLSNEEYHAMLMQFVAPVAADFISPHLTGGSVDVTLFDIETGKYLDMGAEFDEPTVLSYTAAYEKQTNHIAHKNRRILYNAMVNAGFTNITSEWWHYDYGNQLWAHYNNKDFALYGEAKLSEPNIINLINL